MGIYSHPSCDWLSRSRLCTGAAVNLSIYCLLSCNWFSRWVFTAARPLPAPAIGSHTGYILPPLLRLVLTLGTYCLPFCDWFSHWVHTASPPAIGSHAGGGCDVVAPGVYTVAFSFPYERGRKHKRGALVARSRIIATATAHRIRNRETRDDKRRESRTTRRVRIRNRHSQCSGSHMHTGVQMPSLLADTRAPR
eukprot:1182118-Prorocentrum_minimum.AAC.6